MINSSIIIDIGGNARVVSLEKTDEFRQRIASILKGMTQRSFTSLRTQAICILEEMHKKSNPDEPFNKNTFSKHFWYDFKKAHPDIEELYSKIPLRRKNFQKDFNNKILSHNGSDQPDEFENDIMINLSDFEDTSDDSNFQMESINDGETESYWSNNLSQGQSPSLEKLLESIDFLATADNLEYDQISEFDVSTTDKDNPISESFDYTSKMIIESEENDRQRDFFRIFYHHGF